MAVIDFPPAEKASGNGLIAIGGDLKTHSLVLAYRQGIFPWPIAEDFPLTWFSPDPRGVVDFSGLKVSKRLRRYLRRLDLEIFTNTQFESVMNLCSQVKRKTQLGTWITQEIIDSYVDFHRDGFAYSVEGKRDGHLVAGIYGVVVDGVVSAESMFTLESNAGKGVFLALMHIIYEIGIEWLDTQSITNVVRSLGGKKISRKSFLERCNHAPNLSMEDIFGRGRRDISFF